MTDPFSPEAPVPTNSPPPGDGADYLAARRQKRTLLEQQRSLWEAGHSVQPEDLLPRWPTNPAADPDVASILFEDFRQRRAHGQSASLDDYKERYPEQKEALDGLAARELVLHSVGGKSGGSGQLLGLPEVGDLLFGFRLKHELGRGAFARVFLAEQSELAGRPVVLKVSAIEGSEPQTLAQLQHTHVVPIYSVHEDPRAGLRVVCMPYFGGASLTQVLQEMWRQSAGPVYGSELVAALGRVQAPIVQPRSSAPSVPLPSDNGPPALSSSASATPVISRHDTTIRVEVSPVPTAPAQPPEPNTLEAHGSSTPLTILEQSSYVRAVAWIVARLAEGLGHAHQRGVLHRDIKSSNILLSADGQPLLLDFNLAHSDHGDQARATLGGTVAYMAPEHLRALVGRTNELACQVDHRADIYGLGMVLFEMLTGHRPFDQSGSYSVLPVQIEAMIVERSKQAPSLRDGVAAAYQGDRSRRTPVIPWSLESVARKCLAPQPGDRYQQAEHLAEDLRCFLEDQPLKHAPELSRVERVQKWTRRHPAVTSSSSIAAAATFVLVTIGAALVGTRSHLAYAQEQLGAAQAEQRKQAYEEGTVRALCLVNTLSDVQDHLRQGLAVCERTLALYGVLDDPHWQAHPDWQHLPPEDRQRLAQDTRELLMQLAWARTHVATSPRDEQIRRLHEALQLLDRADAIEGLVPSRALRLNRALYLEQLGEAAQANDARAQAAKIEPATAQDHYLLATTYARRGTRAGYADAVAALNRALALNPHHYWATVQRGICHQEQGDLVLAVGDFGACIGLWPDFAWGYFNRGAALYQSGKKSEAIEDYTRALERDPDFLEAYLNRALARLELHQYAEALADLDAAARRGRNDPTLHASRGMALEGLGRFTEAEESFRTAFAGLSTLSPELQSPIRYAYGLAVLRRTPDKAQAVFDQVLRDDPRQPQALYGRAAVAMRKQDEATALQFLNRALEAAPTFAEARRNRALLWARSGRLDAASQDINWCLEKDSEDPVTLYLAACVAAHVAARFHDAQATAQALDLLHKAASRGYPMERAADDVDLKPLRNLPEFQELLRKTNAGRNSQRG
jgi:serine/threonine protein kinase/tetratricopeptide (TPR) repeat protein